MSASKISLRRAARAARAGFSLIEMIAVIVILLILMAFLLPRLGGMREAVQANTTRAFLVGQLKAALGQHENEFGAPPPSTWDDKWGAQPNDSNLGSEILYLSLWSEAMQGLGMDEARLGNTDQDATLKSATILGARDLFELCDDWGNPIAYFHHRDYGRADRYRTIDVETGEEVETLVKAREDARTKSYYNPRGFQLISAGEDGRFGGLQSASAALE